MEFFARQGTDDIYRLQIHRWPAETVHDTNKNSLAFAIERKCEETVHILLKAGASIDIANKRGGSIFYELSVHDMKYSSIPGALLMKIVDKCETEEEAAEKLLNAKCPLHVAVMLKNSKIIKFYLDRGMKNVVPRGADRASALHFAVYFQDLNIVKLLLENGADINIPDSKGYTPIMYVRESESGENEHLEMLKYLLEQNPMLTTCGRRDLTVMQIFPIFRNCRKETVELMLQLGKIDLQARDTYGNTALHYVAGNRNPGVAALLPIDIDITDYKGFKALDFAVIFGHLSTVQMLIDHGANVNSQDVIGVTPLFRTIFRPDPCDRGSEYIELLLDNGADVQVVDKNNWTIVDEIKPSRDFFKIQPILAHFAILEATGTTIKNEISTKIKADDQLQKCFEICKQQLEELKKIIIYESLTVFELLIASKKKLRMYLRNQELAAIVEQFDYEKNPDVYYNRKLQQRITCALQELHFKKLVGFVFYKIMGIAYESYPLIIDQIYDYLSDQDLQNLIQTFE